MRATTLQCETHQKGARSTGAWEGRWASRYGAGTATLRGRSVSSAIGALFLSRSRCSSYPMTASPGRTDGQREPRVDGVLDHAYAAFLSPVALSDSYRSPATARRWSISGDGDPFRSRATWNSVCSAMPHAQQTRLRSWLLQPCSHRLPAHRRFRPRHPLFGLHLYGPLVPGGLARLEAGLALFLRRLPGTRPAHGLWVGDAVARSGMRSVASAVGLVVLSIARLPAVTP
jgi:hypothetical protein